MSPATPEHTFQIGEVPNSRQHLLPPGLTIEADGHTVAWWLRDKEQGRKHFFLCPVSDQQGRPDEQTVLIASVVDRRNRGPTYFYSDDGTRLGQIVPRRNQGTPWLWHDNGDENVGQITNTTNPVLLSMRTLAFLVPFPLPFLYPPTTYIVSLPGISAQITLTSGPYHTRRQTLEIQAAESDLHVALAMAISCALLTLRTTQ